MDSIDNQDQGSPSMTAGDRLRTAREAAGLTRSDIASQTKVAERHLLAIEENRFSDLAARTYAVGFARTYARALGLDEAEIAAVVRQQLDVAEENKREVAPSFEPGDPARVPPVRLAWIAGAGAVVVIALLLVFWGNFLSPEGKLPDLLVKQTAVPVAVAPGAPAVPVARQPVDQTVVITATADDVWLSVKDESGQRLLEKTLANGERWTLPPQAQGPRLRTGRPDALQITVGGKAIPKLADKPQTVSGISLVPAALLERTGGAAPAATGGAAAPAPASVPSSRAAPAPAASTPSPRPAASAPAPRTTSTAATSRTTPRPATTQPRAPSSTPGRLSSPTPNVTSTGQSAPAGTTAGATAAPSQPAGTAATVSTETE